MVGELAGGVKGGLAVAGWEGWHRRIVPDIVAVGRISTRHGYQVLNKSQVQSHLGYQSSVSIRNRRSYILLSFICEHLQHICTINNIIIPIFSIILQTHRICLFLQHAIHPASLIIKIWFDIHLVPDNAYFYLALGPKSAYFYLLVLSAAWSRTGLTFT